MFKMLMKVSIQRAPIIGSKKASNTFFKISVGQKYKKV